MLTTAQIKEELQLSTSGLYYWLRVVNIPKRYNENRERVYTNEDLKKIVEKRNESKK